MLHQTRKLLIGHIDKECSTDLRFLNQISMGDFYSVEYNALQSFENQPRLGLFFHPEDLGDMFLLKVS
jgi:hypothetical protein